jgi:ribonuclease P protein component
MIRHVARASRPCQNTSARARRPCYIIVAQLSHTYPKSHRLGGRLEFAAVFDAKVKDARGPLALYSLPNDLGHPRLGISISRRVGNAVRRNRIKRLLRDAFRAHQHDLPRGYDLVFVVRPHAPLILAEYQRLMTALMLKAHASWQRRGEEQRSKQ